MTFIMCGNSSTLCKIRIGAMGGDIGLAVLASKDYPTLLAKA